MTSPVNPWADYIAPEFDFGDFPPGSRVLDVGCGGGTQMQELRGRGCVPIGIDFHSPLLEAAAEHSVGVCRSRAEALPFRDSSFDGVVCKVVMPYLDERTAVHEIARILRPGGLARISSQGAGYFLRYLMAARDWRTRVYGGRTLVNTGWYRMSARRLPGFLGDSIFQSSVRLQRYYSEVGLELVHEQPARRFAGMPVFIYHVVRKRD